MNKTRYIKLAVLYGAFTAFVALVVQIVAMSLMGTSLSAGAFISVAVTGVCIFVVSCLTVLYVWPRIGFDPFDSHTHEPT